MALVVKKVRRRYSKPVQFLVDWGCIAVLFSVFLPVLSLVIFLVVRTDSVFSPFMFVSTALSVVFGDSFSGLSHPFTGYLSIVVVAVVSALPAAVAFGRVRYSRIVAQ